MTNSLCEVDFIYVLPWWTMEETNITAFWCYSAMSVSVTFIHSF